MTTKQVLVISSNLRTLALLQRSLSPYLPVLPARSVGEASLRLQNAGELKGVLIEHTPGDMKAVEFLKQIRNSHPNARRVLLTDACDLALVVAALHSGAADQIVYHPIDPKEVLTAILPAVKVQPILRQATA